MQGVMQVIEMQTSVQPDAAEINPGVTDGEITRSMSLSPLCAALPPPPPPEEVLGEYSGIR